MLNAVKEHSKLLDRRTVTPLYKLLNYEKPIVRKEACTGLRKQKHPELLNHWRITLKRKKYM
jgi:hypothetical protein